MWKPRFNNCRVLRRLAQLEAKTVALADDVAAVEASAAAAEARVAAFEKAQADTNAALTAQGAALQAEIDALKAAGDTTGLSDRLQAVKAGLDAVNPAATPTP